MKRLFRLMFGVLMLTVVVSAQSGGVLVEGSVRIRLNADAFNPLVCSELVPDCRRLMEKVYPSLFGVDSETLAAGIIESPALTPDETWTLRPDLTWSDGTPITAHDVLFTWAARTYFLDMASSVQAMQVVDDSTVMVQYHTEDCAALARANFLVLPSHSFAPTFREYIDSQRDQGVKTIKQWFSDRNFEPYFSNLQYPKGIIPATAGAFTLAEIRPDEEIRLISDDLAYILRKIEENEVDAFLKGEIDLLINPPYNRRQDLVAKEGLQIVEQPGYSSDFILFNVANPDRPRDAFYESGAQIEQGHHPIFSDYDVRRAFQLAVDVDELIRVALQGDGIPVASSLPLTSWGSNPDLAPIPFDPREAERILEAAGWKDTNRDGVRECHGCETAEEGYSLSIALSYQAGDNRDVVAELIARQVSRIGFNIYVSGENSPSQQRFDAHLVGISLNPDPDQVQQFSREGDVLDTGLNYTSYHDETLVERLNAARTVVGCEPQTRASLYREAQTLIQEQQPYAFLYTRTDFIAVQPDVVGFTPLPGHPFWNIADWRVVR